MISFANSSPIESSIFLHLRKRFMTESKLSFTCLIETDFRFISSVFENLLANFRFYRVWFVFRNKIQLKIKVSCFFIITKNAFLVEYGRPLTANIPNIN